jgi:ABC-type phosphate transport system substrate-binding protein
MTRRLLLISFFVLALAPRGAFAEPAYRVIVNPNNPIVTINKSLLSKMLLKTQTAWSNGNRILPVDQRTSSKVRDVVSRSVHGRSASVIKNWWNQQIFAGKGVPPPELASDAKVIAYVISNPGAIGYVSTDANVSDVKVVAVTE